MCILDPLEDVNPQDPKIPSLYVATCPFLEDSLFKAYYIVGVSNGLVLGGKRSQREDLLGYNIWNPITRQRISLPLHAECFEFVSSGFVTCVEDGILTSYRVVRLEAPPEGSNLIRFEVSIAENGEWKDFTICTDQTICVHWHCEPAVLNRVLHWITLEHGIMAYDPYLKPDCLRLIPLPSDHGLKSISNLCNVHEGRLRYFEIFDVYLPPHGFSSFSFWALNDYSTGECCLQHRISSADILFCGVLSGKSLDVKPISFHPFEPDIVYLIYRSSIASCNMKTRRLEWHHDPYKVRLLQWSISFPFVIPPWPTSTGVPQG